MSGEEEMTVAEAEELEMELELASFEQSLPDDVELRDTHRIAFRAGFTQARRAEPDRTAGTDGGEIKAANPSREITKHERDFGFAPDAFPERPPSGERPPPDVLWKGLDECIKLIDALLTATDTLEVLPHGKLRERFVDARSAGVAALRAGEPPPGTRRDGLLSAEEVALGNLWHAIANELGHGTIARRIDEYAEACVRAAAPKPDTVEGKGAAFWHGEALRYAEMLEERGSAYQRTAHSPLCSGNGVAPNPGCSCGVVERLYAAAVLRVAAPQPGTQELDDEELLRLYAHGRAYGNTSPESYPLRPAEHYAPPGDGGKLERQLTLAGLRFVLRTLARAAAPQQPDGPTCPKCGVEVVVAPTPIHPWWCPSCHERGTLRAAAPQPPDEPWIRPNPEPLACYCCGLLYGGPGWMDAVVPNEVWAQISPTGNEGGILCISCMSRRCQEKGIEAHIKITSGPFAESFWLAEPILWRAAPGASPHKLEVEMSKTLDWPDPTPEMLTDPRFEAVWRLIKGWDISTDPAGTEHRMYSGAMGNHVRAILDALGVGASPADLEASLREQIPKQKAVTEAYRKAGEVSQADLDYEVRAGASPAERLHFAEKIAREFVEAAPYLREASSTSSPAVLSVNAVRTWLLQTLCSERVGPGASPPACPQCAAEGATSETRLDEKWNGPGLHLSKWWCSKGHSWSVRSMPWGADERRVLRQAREAAALRGPREEAQPQ